MERTQSIGDSLFSIYKLTNKCNGNFYIGYTRLDPAIKRFDRHRLIAEGNYKHPGKVHNAIKKYGIKSFEFEILEIGENEEYGLTIAEPMYIAWLNPQYNLTSGGEGALNLHEESCKKISKFHSGRHHTDDHRNKVRLSKLGKKRTFTPEWIENLSKSTKGRKKPIDVCPHCNSVGARGVMQRWHFNNCKEK